MRRWTTAVALLGALWAGSDTSRADEKDKDAVAVLDKAIEALGGAEKLGAAKAITMAAKGNLLFGGNENPFSSKTTTQGLDQFRSEFSGEFSGNTFEVVSVLNKGKGWRKFGDMTMELTDDDLANEKRSVYLLVCPMLVAPLKGDAFKVQSAGEEKEGEVTHNVLKVIGPDGKDFKIYFEKEGGLPAKIVATVSGFGGEEFEQETSFKDYKDFGGIRRATKVNSKRDGELFIEQTITEFKTHESVDPKTFDEPE